MFFVFYNILDSKRLSLDWRVGRRWLFVFVGFVGNGLAFFHFNIHGMVFNQSVDGGLLDDLQVDVEFLGDIAQEVGIVISQRTDETHGVAMVIVLADAAGEEAAQVVGYQVVDIVVVQVVGQKIGEGAEEAVGERTVVDRLHHFVGIDAEFFVEVVGHVLGGKPFQYVRQKQFPHDGATAFVS